MVKLLLQPTWLYCTIVLTLPVTTLLQHLKIAPENELHWLQIVHVITDSFKYTGKIRIKKLTVLNSALHVSGTYQLIVIINMTQACPSRLLYHDKLGLTWLTAGLRTAASTTSASISSDTCTDPHPEYNQYKERNYDDKRHKPIEEPISTKSTIPMSQAF